MSFQKKIRGEIVELHRDSCHIQTCGLFVLPAYTHSHTQTHTKRERERDTAITYRLNMIKYILLLSKQGKVRLVKWYLQVPEQVRQRTIREIGAVVPLRKSKMCNVIEHGDGKVVYRRYASLYFVAGVDADENELSILDFMQRYVESLDALYGNVCELDIVFNSALAYAALDECVIGGHISESGGHEVVSRVRSALRLEEMERDGSGQMKGLKV